MFQLIENLIFHYEFARHLRKNIQGLTWRKALGYHCPKGEDVDPIEAARAALSKMRQRTFVDADGLIRCANFGSSTVR